MANFYDANGNAIVAESDKMLAMASITIEYGRASGSNYYFIHIPKYTVGGKRLTPKVALTSADGSTTGTKISVPDFAKRENTIFAINASLFNTSTLVPQGQTIINGVSITNTPMTDDMGTAISDDECYPLCIYDDGSLASPYERNVDTSRMIADGVSYAVTGWGQFIENFAKVDSSKYNEIVHAGKYIRQCIGQYDNGDYFVCSVDCGRNGISSNDAGMTYGELADLLIAKGVKYAYSLDGGGSCQSVIGNRLITPVWQGSSSRVIPAVIYFDIVDDSAEYEQFSFTVVKYAFDCNTPRYLGTKGGQNRASLNPSVFKVGSGVTVRITIPNGYYCGPSTFTIKNSSADFHIVEGEEKVFTNDITKMADCGWKSGTYTHNMGSAEAIGFNFKRSDDGAITDADLVAIKTGFSFEIL